MLRARPGIGERCYPAAFAFVQEEARVVRSRSRRLLLLGLLACVARPLPAQDGTSITERVTAAVRGPIEAEFRQQTGLGFTSFACDLPGPPGPGTRFDCDAVDDEGDSFRYSIQVDAEGSAEVVLVTDPAAQVTPEQRAVLDPPCRAFLERYARGDWKAIHAGLGPSLREELSLASLRGQLEPVRAALGELRGFELAHRALRHDPGRLELEYALEGTHGPGVARFGLHDEGEGLAVTAFSLAPAPGSAVFARLLENELRETLARQAGEPVDRITAPLGELRQVGDAVAGTARLAGGAELAIGVTQKGRRDDFDRNDYGVAVLDAPWLISRALADRLQPGGSVECPARVVSDGGTQTCLARLASGESLSVDIARRGGEHRLTRIEPAQP